MTQSDAVSCRRALREIREIAAVTLLDGAQMSEQEALEMMAAIADWAVGDSRKAPRECSDALRRVDAMIGQADIEHMDDHAAVALFRKVTALFKDGDADEIPGSAH